MNQYTKRFLSSTALFLCIAATCSTPAIAQDEINVYGPGGPAPSIQEAAKAFGAANQLTVNVVAGPTNQWIDKAKQDADIVFSGAENMMADFAKALPGAFDLVDAQPMYLRPVAILVRPGNPKKIRGFRDLLAPGIKVLTVAGTTSRGYGVALVRTCATTICELQCNSNAKEKILWLQTSLYRPALTGR
ncbi:substrate-binding domain-containing protein [Polaromonas sp. CG_9.11]|uniref:substrate-binding domain-containing protein n=1 Tax=Polaromonas sp. CG_9.11 TaxID=2787730 RepID=UPI0018CAC633|nr:substrate-binding domain-containing protein [Polaromonas sp. CG_9.11]MBG6078019.1 accessory colonization factor AcfC [Polaromonas sp. CG_9.11]